MVIEVDDSGWGDLLGGVVIVMRRKETNQVYVEDIPLELFQDPEFKYKSYLRYALIIVIKGISHLEVQKEEPIHICSGYIFTKVREGLEELGFKVIKVKIEGPTQETAENEFLKHLEKLGVGKAPEIRTIRSFTGFMNWLKEDLENREKYVKTGWNSWPRLRGGIS
jgi:hypothetical protein